MPDREASSLAAWLAKRPGIEVVCRDRAPFFAEGATVAPGGAGGGQVASLAQLERGRRAMRRRPPGLPPGSGNDPAQAAPEPDKAQDPTGSPWPTGHRFADRTRAKHTTVHELLAAGLSRRAIGRQLHMTSRTVKLFADAATPEDPFRGHWQGRPDTPGQQAIRAKIDELGLGEVAITAARSFNKVEAANVLSFCLEPFFDHLSEQLNEVIIEHMAGVFRRPGELDSAEDLMAGWLAAIQHAGEQ
ncbi:hypothetical protein [Streptomyces sp. NPDC051211]|uniref:hypothetical protein n=1 Tax=Streptomyces sp. NPDC051211 TaxID=3154643 RepID=UPI00344DC1EE